MLVKKTSLKTSPKMKNKTIKKKVAQINKIGFILVI